MPEALPVLIVGAGPAGLVAALFLAQNNITFRIIDKADSHHVGSRGFGVQPRTYELFQILGILDDVQKHNTPIPTMRAYKLPGGTVPVKTWDLYEKTGVWPDRPFANGACLSQDLLEEILRSHLAKHGVSVELGKGLVGIEQTADIVSATIAVHKAGQPTDQHEVITSRYLLGTDGARGTSRKSLGLTFQGETRDADGMVWGDVEIDGLGTDFWHIWGKPGHFTIMARPLSPFGNRFGIGITGQDFDPRDLAHPEGAKEFIYTQTGRTDITFGKFTWLSYFRPNMRMVNKFQEGHAFVVGDSAHVHSPTGGQGLNCSVQDASNLAWKLALVLKGLASPSLLSSYNAERLPVITQMLHATTALYTHTVAKEKSTAAPEASEDDKRSGWFRWRNNALEMYGINYRYSDIVLEERNTQPQDAEDALARAYSGYEGLGTLRAGDRAPEAPGLVRCGTETSLFKLFKVNIHTLLVFVSEANETALKGLKSWPQTIVQTFVISGKVTDHSFIATVFLDRDGNAANAYRVDNGSILFVAIRPDGFIGAIVKNVDGIDRYLSKIIRA